MHQGSTKFAYFRKLIAIALVAPQLHIETGQVANKNKYKLQTM